jgi:hypothetical protein
MWLTVSQFLRGTGDIRAPSVRSIANSANLIFNIHDEHFYNCLQRPEVIAVKELLDKKQFLYRDEPPRGYLMNESVLKVWRPVFSLMKRE